MLSTKEKGYKGEILAINYLQKNNYIILETNFKFGRFGEIDIIMKKGDIYPFFEVKYRENNFFGTPEESITTSKLRKFGKTIEYYVIKNNIDFKKISFHIITIAKQKK